ncbi:DNA polymerase II large subunit [archaeon CG10_big_fil_rev_8_21_14_0_10_43_11]|nr:MAG: DNA polymerase II large subunit [archaeon CG10_big_fil_rev_8_21_14_0_10_43_11]
MVVASPVMQEYFATLEKQALVEYELARAARKKGRDPKPHVEVTLARNIGERIEGLISALYPTIANTGLANAILELEHKYDQGDWRVAFAIAKQCAHGVFITLKSREEYMDLGTRVGLAYLTQGTVSAPLEGIVGIKAKKRKDGKEYLAVYYAGPIRAAGGTPMTVSVVLVDYLRELLGYAEYDPTDDEIKRYYHELEMYNDRVSRLQYFPSQEEVQFLVKNMPIEINGSPTSKREVLIYKDVERVETAQIRGGMCLALAEGVAGRAKKLWGGLARFTDFDFSRWDFLKEFLDLQKKQYAHAENDTNETQEDTGIKVKPSFKYLRDAVAGRPVFSFPSHPAGFRIRYGRTRVSGVEAYGFNPTTGFVLNKFLAIGTQLSIERPGKGCTVTTCEVIRGPVVKLTAGDVVRVDTMEVYEKHKYDIAEVLFLGDVLVNFGAFREHKHVLVPSPFVEEWWALELESKAPDSALAERFVKSPFQEIGYDEAKAISRKFDIPLHPSFTFHWNLLSADDLRILVNAVCAPTPLQLARTDNLTLKASNELKRVLETALIPHRVSPGVLIVEHDNARALLDTLGGEDGFDAITTALARDNDASILRAKKSALTILNTVAPFALRDTAGFTLGARMGRPEKAKMRKMTASPHMLFPVGEQGGRFRSLNSAFEQGFILSDFPLRYCDACSSMTFLNVCEKCGAITKHWNTCRRCKTSTSDTFHCLPHKALSPEEKESYRTSPFERRAIDTTALVNSALEKLRVLDTNTLGNGFSTLNFLVKGVKGVTNETKTMEIIEKGILRAKNNVFVNKDGTMRLDMTQLPVTHFKPIEIGTSVARLTELGYTHDISGKPLSHAQQILEIRPQDIILPACQELPETDTRRDVLNITRFLDGLLKAVYGLDAHYAITRTDDLAGVLCIALAPHTSAGTLCRIIGFSKTQGGLAHPLLHAATRRDCDGDEVGFMLLLDAFINFSHDYLPNQRGTKNMDCPLVLALSLDPSVIDDEVFNMDVVWQYPLSFYEDTLVFKEPSEVSLRVVENLLETPEQFEGYGYTHPVDNFNNGIRVSAYKTLPTMDDKVEKQMDLAFKVRSIDVAQVATLVIEKHLLRDIKGNLRKFSSQGFRCIACNEKFRRVPLRGNCTRCSGKIVLTIHEGSVLKYVNQCLDLSSHYKVNTYLKQSIDVLRQRLESVFAQDPEKQEKLSNFFT